MEGGPPIFPRDSSCPAVLWIQPAAFTFRIRDSHTLWSAFPCSSPKLYNALCCPKPRKDFSSRFGLFRVRSPLLTKSRLISFPSGTEMFHFPESRLQYLFIQYWITGHYSSWVAPFGYLRINSRVQIPGAFRSLPRPSSPVDAKASFMCP